MSGLLIFVGFILVYVLPRMVHPYIGLVSLVVGMLLTLAGCYLWTLNKGIHWGHTAWGLITPLGLIVIASMKGKEKNVHSQEST